MRREFADGFSLQANYRFSKWLDTSSDTSTGQFQDNSEPGKGAQDVDCLQLRTRAVAVRHSAPLLGVGALGAGLRRADRASLGTSSRELAAVGVVTAQSGRPFSVWNGAAFSAGGDYNADGGGGAVGGGFYDRPNAPAPGPCPRSFSQDDFLNGLFDASDFPKPAPGTNGTLGPQHVPRAALFGARPVAVAQLRGWAARARSRCRLDAYNALNTLNLFLPNADLSVSNFGKSTQAFDPRTLQIGVKFLF